MHLLIVNCAEWGPEHKRMNYPDDVGQWIVNAFADDTTHFDIWRSQRETEPPHGQFDGIVISGSSSSAYDEQVWIHRLSDKIREWVNQRTPLLGICFGHQLIAQSLGGVVRKNPQGWEGGICSVELTEAGKQDALFADFPSPSKVMQSHQDIVMELPPESERLAFNAKSPIQAFRIGSHVRTVQFHPEFTENHLRFLIEPRRERLTANGVDVDAMLRTLEPLPGRTIILSNFLTHFVKNNRPR